VISLPWKKDVSRTWVGRDGFVDGMVAGPDLEGCWSNAVARFNHTQSIVESSPNMARSSSLSPIESVWSPKSTNISQGVDGPLFVQRSRGRSRPSNLRGQDDWIGGLYNFVD
jgi:hypothetical protein